MPILDKWRSGGSSQERDYAGKICSDLIAQTGVVMVPSTDFGQANGARISMVLEREPFAQALDKAFSHLS